eukprot:gene10266-11974_t
MIANQIVDPLSFSLIFSSYSHLFTLGSLMSAVSGGNIVALDMIHKHLIECGITFSFWNAIAEAFMCGHVHILKYIVENVDLTVRHGDLLRQGFYGMGQRRVLVQDNHLKRRHLEGYLYLRDKLTSSQFATVFGTDQYHVLYMEDIALFNETFPVLDRNEIREFQTILFNIIPKRSQLWLEGNKKKATSKRRVDVGYLDFVEHVHKSCIVNGDAKELATISEKRNRARSLTSNLTPEKEVLLTLLEFANDVCREAKQYLSIIRWSDLDLTEYILKIFGFDLICCHGTLAQVEAAHQLLGPEDKVTDLIWSSKNVDVLRFIHANRTEPCPRDRLVGEYNLEIVKFLVESCPPLSLSYSLQELMTSNNVGIIKYLHSQQDRCIITDQEALNDPGYGVLVRTPEMMQYLVDINYDNNKIGIDTQDYNIATIQLFINKVGINSDQLIRSWTSIMQSACRYGDVGHVEYLLSVVPIGAIPINTEYSLLDHTLPYGCMDTIYLLLASNRGGGFLHASSWIHAGIAGDINLFELVRANSIHLAHVNLSLTSANDHGCIDLVKHICTNYSAQFDAHNIMLSNIFAQIGMSGSVILLFGDYAPIDDDDVQEGNVEGWIYPWQIYSYDIATNVAVNKEQFKVYAPYGGGVGMTSFFDSQRNNVFDYGYDLNLTSTNYYMGHKPLETFIATILDDMSPDSES